MWREIANSYDIANELISLGLHRFWKKIMVKNTFKYLVSTRLSVLDIACGTGDILCEIYNNYREKVEIYVGLDPEEEMLKKAIKKCHDKSKIFFVKGKAENLPFKNRKFNAIFCSFGVRNFSYRAKAFREIKKALKIGGIFTILEFSLPCKNMSSLINSLAWKYTEILIPPLGYLITHHKEAYDYLVTSIEKFPCQKELEKELKQLGFKILESKPLFPPFVFLCVMTKTVSI